MERTLSNALASNGRAVWLQVGTLLDGCGTQPLRNAHVVYDADAIQYVGRSGHPPSPGILKPNQSKPDLVLPGHTLLPGLIEAHAHLFLEGGELNPENRLAYLMQTPERLLEVAQTRLEKLVHVGVMAVRDAGDKDGVGLALSKLYLDSERPVMPYLDSPGAAINRKGRYGSFMAEPLENYSSPRECVEARVNAGAHRIKLIPTGIINFKKAKVTSAPQMTREDVAELVRAAKALGRQTFAHASGDDGIEVAIEVGVDTIEHGFFIRNDQLARMRDRQTGWVPTFAPVQGQVDHADEMGWDDSIKSNLQRILDQHAASLQKAQEMGVQIIAGSDAGSCGVVHGHGLLYELELMEKAGMPALAVINAATGNGSRRLGFHEKVGQIKPGYRSRMILTEHSPLETICNLRKSTCLIYDDVVYPSGERENGSGL